MCGHVRVALRRTDSGRCDGDGRHRNQRDRDDVSDEAASETCHRRPPPREPVLDHWWLQLMPYTKSQKAKTPCRPRSAQERFRLPDFPRLTTWWRDFTEGWYCQSVSGRLSLAGWAQSKETHGVL